MIGRRMLQPEARPPSIRFRPPAVHIPLTLLATGWALLLAGRGVRWLAVHPRCTLVGAGVVWLIVTDTVLPALVLALVGAGALLLWWTLYPASFVQHLLRPVQLELREWLTYRREWQPAMLTSGLSLRESWGGDLPTLRKVSSDAGRDLLRVKMLPGQTLEQWSSAAAGLAQTFGARAVRARRVAGRPQELDLLVTLRSTPIRHVTERTVGQEPDQVPAPRGAFPRAPRGGAA